MLGRIFKAIFGLQEPKKQKGYTRAQLAKELEPGLNALFGAEYAKYENKNRNHPRYCDPCLLYTSPSPRDGLLSRMPSSA